MGHQNSFSISKSNVCRSGTICFTISFIASLLTGCAGISPYATYPGDDSVDKSYYAKYWTIDELKTYDATPAANQSALRKEIVEGRIASIDIFYREYVSSLYEGEKKFDITTDGAVLALSAIGTIGAPTFDSITLKIVSATSGLITGFKSKWDADVFYNQTLPVLVKTMDQSRSAVLTDLRTKESDSTIPLNQLLGEVNDYFEAGGVLTAINILAQTDVSEPQAKSNTTPVAPAAPPAVHAPAPPPGNGTGGARSPVQKYFNL